MESLYLKAVHIIFVVTWFAGLFYMPRLFIYASEASEKGGEEGRILMDQFHIMQRRLWFGITWPSAIITLIMGILMLHFWMDWAIPSWLWLKLAFVFGLYAYHWSLHRIFLQQQRGVFRYNSGQLRLWNEVATVFLVAIVFLVVLKDGLKTVYGVLGLLVLIVVLMLAIKIYKRLRSK